MSTASLARVAVAALLPRTVEREHAERVQHALGQPLVDAIPVAFESLDTLDPGAFWVIRELRAQVQVPVSRPERCALAAAEAMAAAVTQVVREGPSSNAVRFTTGAAYAAAYVAARLSRAGEAWVFDRLRPLEALPAADVLPAAARLLEVDLLAVVTELVRAGGWPRLLDLTDRPAAQRLAAALARLPGAAVHPTESLVAEIAAARAEEPGAVRGSTPAHRRLSLLGLRARTHPLDPTAVAAVWRLERDEQEPIGSHAAPPNRPDPPSPSNRGQPSGEPAVDEPGQDGRAPLPGVSALHSPGAVAFLLVPDLAEVLLLDEGNAWLNGPDRPAAEVRAAVLAAVIGRGVGVEDPAVRLAAGAEPWSEEDPEPVTGIVAPRDPLLTWKHEHDAAWFAPLAARAPELVPLARSVARRFAQHLTGLGRSGLPFLGERVLPLGGEVRIAEDAVLVELPRPPLHVLLVMASLDAFSCQVPWLELPVLLTHEER